MRRARTIAVLAVVLAVCCGTSTKAATLQTFDFESPGGFTPSFVDDAGETTDYFRRTDGSDISGVYNGATGTFFAAQDIDGVGSTGAAVPATITFDPIDITGATAGLRFSIDLAEDDDGANQDWDDSDFVLFEYSIDGNPFANLLAIENDGSQFNSAPFIDTDFDGTGDGIEITDTFTTFSSMIMGSGSSLTLRGTFSLDSGDEDLAIDNLTITAVPEPSAFVVLGLGGLTAFLIRRRRNCPGVE